MRIISRYIARDIVSSMAAVAIVLLLIILGKLFIQLLAEVLDGDLSANMLGTVLLLGVIRFLVILLPFSLFLSIILVLTRMHKDSEINAAMAGGASNKEFLQAVMLVGVPIILLLYVLVSYVSPWAYRLAEVIENVTEQTMVLDQITPGKFVEMEGTGWVIYAQGEDNETDSLTHVFLQRDEGENVVVEIAERARMQEIPGEGEAFVLFNGRTVDGVPGSGNFAISEYEEHRIYPPRTDFTKEASKPKYLSINTLFNNEKSDYRAEYFQRLSIIISTLFLIVLAIPLSKVTPNSGRFSRLAIAVLIYILYLNLVIVTCSWIKRGESIGMISLIVVHSAVLVGTYLAYQGVFFHRLKQLVATK